MENTKSNVIHNLDDQGDEGVSYKTFFIFLGFAIVIGVLSGFILASFKKTSSGTQGNNNVKMEKTAGIADKKTFKDSAEGILKEGGVDGEGNFHLARPGGESQNVYLTSTTVDLSPYIGKKVKVWGQTFSGQKAGWLMDVGLVELQ